MDFHTAGVGNLAATSELNGTPVALFAGGHLFHVGVDPSCPATSPDRTITPTAGAAQSNPALVTDPSTGAVWAAWFQDFNKMGYWIDPILPTQGAPIEAPHSASTAAKNNQPLEPVAIAARASGGIYMAYCATSSSQPCAHIDLWKVGSAGVRVVPGSHNVAGARVALAAGPGGRLSVIWYDAAKNMIHAVRTNTAGTSFGVLRSIKPPKHTSAVTTLQSQGSSGRLDVVVADELTTGPVQLLHTQILAGLSLTAKPSKFSHKKTKKVVFAASDAGQAVPAAKVSCLGKHGKSNAAGRVTLSFHKGEPKGKHVCTVSKAGYNAGKATVKVT
jgi:hypothetical protein